MIWGDLNWGLPPPPFNENHSGQKPLVELGDNPPPFRGKNPLGSFDSFPKVSTFLYVRFPKTCLLGFSILLALDVHCSYWSLALFLRSASSVPRGFNPSVVFTIICSGDPFLIFLLWKNYLTSSQFLEIGGNPKFHNIICVWQLRCFKNELRLWKWWPECIKDAEAGFPRSLVQVGEFINVQCSCKPSSWARICTHLFILIPLVCCQNQHIQGNKQLRRQIQIYVFLFYTKLSWENLKLSKRRWEVCL